jgi:hypothetical protein
VLTGRPWHPHTSYTQVKDSACWVGFWNLTFVTRFHTPRTHKSRIQRVELNSGISLLLQDSTHLVHTSQGFRVLGWILESHFCYKIPRLHLVSKRHFKNRKFLEPIKVKLSKFVKKRQNRGDFGLWWPFHNAHNNLCASRERTGA